jgi:hypothetical protein
LEVELTRLVIEGGLPAWFDPSGTKILELDGGRLPGETLPMPKQVGIRVARVIYGGSKQ